jgi:CDGSH iron-sulfur domain-containing protein 3
MKPTKEDNMSDVIITPKNDGPYHVKGTFEIVTESGRKIAFDGNEAWLCRCGQSANKPFCDGTHKKAGFKNNLDEKS